MTEERQKILDELAWRPMGATLNEMRGLFEFDPWKRMRNMTDEGLLVAVGGASRLRRYCLPENSEQANAEHQRMSDERRKARSRRTNKKRTERRKRVIEAATESACSAPMRQIIVPACGAPLPMRLGPRSVFELAEKL